MLITHKIDGFLNTIFPDIDMSIRDESFIINQLKQYYTYGAFIPKITINGEWAIIEIDTPTILSQEADYRKTVSLCEKGKFVEAKIILKKLIEQNPANSEYHRIMGQILSDEGSQDDAIDCLIDALRWDSKNGYALVMMGNIFAKFKDDIQTAMKYYDQALVANPNDNIAINNIGGNLLQQGKLEEAKKYFWEALKINNTYPNTHFALGMIAEMENDLHSAFYSTIQAIKQSTTKDALYQNCLQQAFELSQKITSTNTGKKIFREYRHKLEFACDKEIDIIEDSEIPTAAKMEFAENYDREKHTVKFKPNYPAVEHLIMHELVHLDFVIEARKEGLNQLFVSNQSHKAIFIKGIESTIKQLDKIGIEEDSIANYCSGLFEGINRQTFNTPIDLFIEDFLYKEFSELRPYQFISIYGLIQEGIKAVTDKRVVELSPSDILSKSKIYNIVNALQYKELYGIDLVNNFQATPNELKQANALYAEFLEYKDNKEPAEEYELVLHWAEDLKLEKNFELISEDEFRNKRTNIDNLLESIENDPFDVETKNPYKEREMEKFQKSQEAIGTNMAVVMFMVDALQYFKDRKIDEIKKIAFEIAMFGTQGFRPDKNDYSIPSIPNKTFSGYHILAYYYVSWKLAIPEMVSQLQLPFENEYELAISIYKK